MNLIYIALGAAPINQCAGCKTNEVYAYRSVCLEQCPAGTLNNQYNDRGFGCRLCSEKLNQVLINGKCVCNSMSTEKDGVCVLNRGEPYNFLNQISWGDSSSQVSGSWPSNVGVNTFGSTQNLVMGPTMQQQQQTVITTVTTTTTSVPTVVNNFQTNNLATTITNVPTTTSTTVTTPLSTASTVTNQPVSVIVNNNCQ